MRRIIHRSAKAVAFSSSDEDNEDDAFTALSKKQKKVPGKSSTNDDSSGITNKNGDTTATGVATAEVIFICLQSVLPKWMHC
jgi:hypothetical protein